MDDTANIIQFLRPTGLISSLMVVSVAAFVVHLLGRFQERLGNRFTEHRLLIQQVATILRFSIYILSIALCILLSFRLTEAMLVALGGTLAVTIGFALKDLTASVIAGLTILLDRPFQVGDRVSFGGFYGEITAIGLRSSRLVTLDDNLITIPNNKFLTEIVSSGNAGELNMLIQMDFHIGIDQDPALAKRLVADALTSSRYAYLEKPWTVLVSVVMLESYPAIRLRAKVYVMDVRYEKDLETDVTERVLEGFRRHAVRPPAILHRTLEPADGALPPEESD